MEMILLIGGQAAGKSTFYQQCFQDTHLRINLDMLRTRHREKILLEACLRMKQPFVVDNTNPTPEDRQRYIPLARAAGFRVVGYYFAIRLEIALQRNSQRQGRSLIPEKGMLATMDAAKIREDFERRSLIPEKGMLATYRRLQRPAWSEGFDALHVVRPVGEHRFRVEDWRDEL